MANVIVTLLNLETVAFNYNQYMTSPEPSPRLVLISDETIESSTLVVADVMALIVTHYNTNGHFHGP
jgi:hypothetical protein